MLLCVPLLRFSLAIRCTFLFRTQLAFLTLGSTSLHALCQYVVRRRLTDQICHWHCTLRPLARRSRQYGRPGRAPTADNQGASSRRPAVHPAYEQGPQPTLRHRGMFRVPCLAIRACSPERSSVLASGPFQVLEAQVEACSQQRKPSPGHLGLTCTPVPHTAGGRGSSTHSVRSCFRRRRQNVRGLHHSAHGYLHARYSSQYDTQAIHLVTRALSGRPMVSLSVRVRVCCVRKSERRVVTARRCVSRAFEAAVAICNTTPP